MSGISSFQSALPRELTTSSEASRYAIDGLQPSLVVTPPTQQDVATVLALANENDLAVIPWGGGTQQHLGDPPQRYDVALDLTHLDRLVEYESADLTITVEAGMRFTELQRLLGENGQWLRLDPSLPGAATIGGVIATNASGPARLAHGTARDQLIGVSFVTAEGALVKSGGRVVKNVAGYDLGKLQIGALGTLGVITQASFKVGPLPVATRTATTIGSLADLMSAHARLINAGLALQSTVLSKDASQSSWTLQARFAAGQAAVDRSLREFTTLFPNAIESSSAPSTIRNDAPVVVRASVLPPAVAPICEAISHAGGDVVAYPGGGIVYASWSAASVASVITQLRDLCVTHTGALVLERAPVDLKRDAGVWGASRTDFDLMRRLKDTLDPKHTLNPDRYLGGL